jgi:predicted phosphodiesterase
VYHLGDWCSPFTCMIFSELNCELKSVFGNNDADIFKIIKNKPNDVSFYDKFYVDEKEDLKICLFHDDPEEIVNA